MKLTVGSSTLYWASNREEDRFICCVNAFHLVNQNYYEESLHTDNIFGRHEVLDSVRPDLLNLPDGNFCLILQSKRMKRKKKNGRFARGVYKHGLRVSILSVHKYSVDDWIPLHEKCKFLSNGVYYFILNTCIRRSLSHLQLRKTLHFVTYLYASSVHLVGMKDLIHQRRRN